MGRFASKFLSCPDTFCIVLGIFGRPFFVVFVEFLLKICMRRFHLMVIEYSTETLIILPVLKKAERKKFVNQDSKMFAHKTQTFGSWCLFKSTSLGSDTNVWGVIYCAFSCSIVIIILKSSSLFIRSALYKEKYLRELFPLNKNVLSEIQTISFHFSTQWIFQMGNKSERQQTLFIWRRKQKLWTKSELKATQVDGTERNLLCKILFDLHFNNLFAFRSKIETYLKEFIFISFEEYKFHDLNSWRKGKISVGCNLRVISIWIRVPRINDPFITLVTRCHQYRTFSNTSRCLKSINSCDFPPQCMKRKK